MYKRLLLTPLISDRHIRWGLRIWPIRLLYLPVWSWTVLKILCITCMLRFLSKLSAIITPNGPRAKSYCIKRVFNAVYDAIKLQFFLHRTSNRINNTGWASKKRGRFIALTLGGLAEQLTSLSILTTFILLLKARHCRACMYHLESAMIPIVNPATAAAPPAIAPAVSQLSCVVPFIHVLVWTSRPWSS